jgi:histidinol phosphatase-like PHP family hydrolase
MFVNDPSGKFLTGQDWHFHYFPHLHEGYLKAKTYLPKDSMIVIHDSQFAMEGFLSGMGTIAKELGIQQGVELSLSHDVEKVKRNVAKIKEKDYGLILSVHTYNDPADFLDILRKNVDSFIITHHLGHPFHKEKVELPQIIQREFFDFVSKQGLAVELNEKYSRQYNVEFYNGIKSNCRQWYPSTDAHTPKHVGIYRKLHKYSII